MALAVLALVAALLVLAGAGVLTVLLGRADDDGTSSTSAIGGIVVLFLVAVAGLAAWLFLVS
jgi:drug/metabolite transporter (DMT)-like permease